MIRVLLLLLSLLWAAPALAEPYPQPRSLAVNDFADLIAPGPEAELTRKLDALRKTTGVEFTVVTLSSLSDFDAAPSFESFATRLFNGWKIGTSERNDGILFLIVADQRKLRIELGAGYDPEYDIPAQDIIRTEILPAFRDGRIQSGIIAGSDAIITRIADRWAKGLAPVTQSQPSLFDRLVKYLVIAFFVVIGLRIALGRNLRKYRAKLRKCPQCGHRGLDSSPLPEHPSGQPHAQVWVSVCPACQWRESETVTTGERPNKGGDGGFGGGRSSGGGASGSW